MAKIGVAYYEITGDLSPLRRKLAQSDEEVKRFVRDAAQKKLSLDKSTFDLALKQGEAQLVRLEKKRAKAVLKLDVVGVKNADRQVAQLKANLAALRDQRVNVDVNSRGFAAFRRQLSGVSGGLGNAEGAMSRFNRATTTLRNLFRLIRWPIFIAGAGLAAQALSTLTAAVGALVSALGPLSGLLVAIPAGLGTLVQGIGTAVLGLGGVGDAVKASMEQSRGATVDATKAAEAHHDATRRVADAQRDAAEAQREVNVARQEARAELQALRREEQGTTLAVEEARAELQRLRADQATTPLELERARLDLDDAKARARQVREDRQQAERRGADGSDRVVQAERRLADATRTVAEAQRDLTTKTNQGSSAQNKFAEEMAKLSPAGRSFARFIISLKPRMDELRATAQQGLLPGLERGITSAMRNFGALRRVIDVTSRAMGRAGERFGSFLGRRDVGKDLELIGTRNARVMGRAARASTNFASAMRHVVVAAGPLLDWLSKSLVGFSRLIDHQAKAGRESGRLAGFFHRTRIAIERVTSIAGSLGKAFLNIARAGRPLGRGILRDLDRAASNFAKWTASIRGRRELRDYFEKARPVIYEVGRLVRDVTKAFFRLGTQPGVEKLFRAIRQDLLPAFETLIRTTTAAFGPALIGFLTSWTKLITELAGARGPLTLAVDALSLFARSLTFLFDKIPLTRSFARTFIGLAIAVQGFRVLGAVTGINKLVAALLGLRKALVSAEAAKGATGFTGALARGLRSIRASTIGQRIAGELAAGLGVGAIKFRRASERLGRIFRSVLARFGFGAGEAAAAGAAGELGASAAAGGRLGRLRGRFGRLGTRLGTVLGLGIAAAAVLPIAAIGAEVFKKLDEEIQKRFGKGGKLGEFTRNTFGKLVPEIKKGDQGPLLKLLGINEAKKGVKELKDDVKGITDQRLLRKGPSRDTPQPRRPSRDRPEPKLPTRSKTVEIQTPILSLRATDVRKSMDRIQAVLRRELGQARRLIERHVDNWSDIFRGFRLLRGDDPLHLRSGILRSAEDARQALRGIVESLGRVLERLSALARVEGREVGEQLARGIGRGDAAVKAAERIRAGVTREFRLMQRGSSDAARDMVSNLRATFSRLPEVVRGSTTEMLKIVLTAMRSLGATGRGRIVSAVEKIEGKARGGFIGGSGRQDTVYDEVPPGTLILNRHQQPFVERAMAVASALGVQSQSSLSDVFSHARGGQVAPVMVAPGEAKVLPHEQGPIQTALAVASQVGLSPYGSIRELVETVTRPHYLAAGGVVPKALDQEVRQRLVPVETQAPKTLVQRVVQKFAKGGKPLPGVEAPKQSQGRPSFKLSEGVSGARISEKTLKTVGGAVINRLDQTVIEGDKRGERRQSLARGGLIRSLVQSFTEGDRREELRQRFVKGGKVRGIVPIPGQPGESIHSSILNQVVSLVRRYKLRVTDGYAPTGHKAAGDHPKGLAIDVVPGSGGSWNLVDRLAAWAEPSQNQPRKPFRWVGYTGDPDHGRGDHLHLSWLGGGRGGAIAGIDIPKVRARVRGPVGATRDMVSGAVKRVERAANSRLSAEGGGDAPVSTTGKPRRQGRYDVEDLRTLARSVGFARAPLWARVAWAESAGDPKAKSYANARGLWQIHVPAHVGKGKTLGDINPNKLYDPIFNAKAALKVSGGGKNLGPWDESRNKGHGGGWGQYLARGGSVRGVQAFAKGGHVGFARKIWNKAKGKLGAQKLPMPRIFVEGGAPGTVGLGASGLDRLTLSQRVADGLGRQDPYSMLIYLHELAHVFQRKIGEGTAQVWARRVAPPIAKALGVPYDPKLGAGDYAKEQRSARKRGKEFILHRQFGLDKKGRPTKATKDIQKLGSWYEHYARGGLIPGFAKGGVVKRIAKQVGATPPAGAKRPSRKKSGRGKSDTIRLRPFRPGRVADYAPSLSAGFTNIWDRDIPFLQEDYDEYLEDARLVEEVFLEDAPGSSMQTVNWGAVRARIAELEGLLSRAKVIEAKVVEARRLAVAMIEELKRVVREQVQRGVAIYRRMRENITALGRLRSVLKGERRKKGKNRDQGTINYIENLIAAIQNQNLELGGTRDELPRNWIALKDNQSSLGRIATIITEVGDALDPNLEGGAAAKLVEIQGRTTRGGVLDDWADTIREWATEKADLQPGGKLVTPTAATGGDTGTNAAAEIKSFLAAIGDLHKTYGSNFQPLKFQRGGVIPGFGLGDKIPVLAEAGEGFINKKAVEAIGGSAAIDYINKIAPRFASGGTVRPVTVNPRTGDLKVEVKEGQGQTIINKNIDARHTFASVPKDEHLWSRNIKHELDSAV